MENKPHSSLWKRIRLWTQAHPFFSAFLAFAAVAALVTIILNIFFLPHTILITTIAVKSPILPSIERRQPIALVHIPFSFPEFKKELPLYETKGYRTAQSYLPTAAVKLNLRYDPESRNAYYNPETNTSVVYIPGTHFIQYSNPIAMETTNQLILSLPEAERLAQELLQKMGYKKEQLSLDQNEIEYLNGYPELGPATSQTSTVIRLQYKRYTQGIETNLSSEVNQGITLYVTTKGVLKGLFPPLTFDTIQHQNVSLLSQAEVLEHIKAGNYTILGQLIDPRDGGPILDSLTSFTFSTITLEYRLDEQQNLLLPFFRLKGEAQTSTNITVPVEILTPATKI
jgi:hypothetical protein